VDVEVGEVVGVLPQKKDAPPFIALVLMQEYDGFIELCDEERIARRSADLRQTLTGRADHRQSKALRGFDRIGSI
jgi:hypothetical protein